VLLHGWAMHSGLWAGLLPALARRHRVHCVDLPGHGHSRATPASELAELVDAVASTLALEREPLTVLGWSLGGVVAQAWALAAPQRVRRVILLSSTPRFLIDDDWPWAMEAGVLESFAADLRHNYRHTLQRFLTLQVQGAEEGRAALGRLRHHFFTRGEPASAVLGDGLAMLRDLDLRRQVPTLSQPTLVICGDRDTLTPLGASRWLAENLPQARLAMIPGAAHAPQISHAQEFLRAVEQFDDAGP
jgi:pimeloyl-[acyl-carrier protein] methyl ester esterase